jgi:hypothetical protein
VLLRKKKLCKHLSSGKLVSVEMVCRCGVCYSLTRFLFACTGLHIVVYASIVLSIPAFPFACMDFVCKCNCPRLWKPSWYCCSYILEFFFWYHTKEWVLSSNRSPGFISTYIWFWFECSICDAVQIDLSHFSAQVLSFDKVGFWCLFSCEQLRVSG